LVILVVVEHDPPRLPLELLRIERLQGDRGRHLDLRLLAGVCEDPDQQIFG
jgi:hypothetical protein